MNIEACPIVGLSLGAEYIQADEEAGIDYSCLVIDLFIMRIVVEFTDE